MIHKKLLSLLVLLMTTVSMSAKFAFSVTLPTGNSIMLDVTPTTTIGEVKSEIQQLTLIPTELQILTFNNQVLVDEQQLSQLPSSTEPPTLSLVSGNYYLNGGSTQNCPVSFKVGNSDGVVTAQEGNEVTVTFTPTAPYVLTAVTAQAYTTWAGARRAEPESTPTIPMLGDITLTPVQGQANTYTFTMPPSHVKFNNTLRQPSGLAWTLGGNELADGATVNYCKGFPFTAPVLVNPNDLAFGTEVDGAGISLDDNNAVTVNDEQAQPGTYTLTATFEGDETYQATTVKFNLVISEPAILSVAADPTTGGTVEVVMPQSGLNVKEITGDMVAVWNDDQYSSEYMKAEDLEGFQGVTLDMAKAWKPDNLDKAARLYYAFDGNTAYWVEFDDDGEYSNKNSQELTKGDAYDMILSTDCTVPSYYTTGYTPVTVIDNQDGTYSVIPGTSVSLKATAANGYQLNSWSQNVTPDADDNTVATITVDATATATAYFGAKEYEVDLTVNGDDDQGTEKAKWTGKAGEQGTAKNFPITAKTGQAVTLNYSGHLKVKGVTATTDYDPLATPLTVEALTAGTIKVNITDEGGDATTLQSGMKYSKDGGTTKRLITQSEDIPVAKGDKVQFYGNGEQTQVYGYFPEVKILGSGDGFQTKVYGNIMSLVDETGFATNTDLPDADYVFYELFAGNTTLIDASELLLPTETLTNACYQAMFALCTNLTKAPKLPAETLAIQCYEGMFIKCTSLTTAPKLPATTLATKCYSDMFYNCTSLTNAYVKAAYTVVNSNCSNMFNGCTATDAVLHTTSDNKASWETKMGTGKTWSKWSVADDWED